MTPIFFGKTLPKRLTKRKVFYRVPRYVVEYLLAKYAPDGRDEAVAVVQEVLQERYVGPDQGEWVRDQLLRHGSFVLLDELSVRVDLSDSRHTARIPSLGELRVEVPFDLPDRFPEVLHGLWGTIVLVHAEGTTRVSDFIPFQVARLDLEEFIHERDCLEEDAWIDLLLRSVGLEPQGMTRRLKLLYLVRLAPLVEPNLHLLEIGPRQTGKTYLLRNTSTETFVVSGGRTTPATLFYHQLLKRPGLIGTQDLVVFDEIAHTRWDDVATVSTLKDYMESGQFTRGQRMLHAQTSLLFMGNADAPDVPPTTVLPRGLKGDTAFIDRLHGILPGFEFPKITAELLTDGEGLVVDYLAAIFKRLRALPAEPDLSGLLPAGLTQRDVRSVERITSGLLKLVYPGHNWTRSFLEEATALALELRSRVQDELHRLNPLEFPRSGSAAQVASQPDPAPEEVEPDLEGHEEEFDVNLEF
ncbi:ATP-dependent Lon protease [Deinobacterium chartae]|uniref:ATP-dependent Lon protease n=1 Tax=Deinobacterium chartae TaxID=521158 RepID=A0A841I3Q5_9DEIO|nr:ATP-dependent Lon protease [Deinobacterium chartae]